MSSPVLSRPRATHAPHRRNVRQLTTHAHLYDDVPRFTPAGRTRRDAPDAIIVPAARPASALTDLIDLAADLGTELVVLCSGQAGIDQVTERMGRVIGARGVVARIDGQHRLPAPKLRTSHPLFSAVSDDRHSDLSIKRNTGLLLARLRGWDKIVFVDDDITLDRADVSRITHLLDHFPVAGMRPTRFPDNSVLCHARRLARLPQDVFVSGAVLGVDCRRRDLAFFPDIYNEDWFFFGDAAAARNLPKPRAARQRAYDPFGNVHRARHEEFGDLLAEGLYALIESSGIGSFEQVVELASERYWTDFIQVRQENIAVVRKHLEQFLNRRECTDDVVSAIRALDASRERYDDPVAPITSFRCADFLEAWRKDFADWRNALPEPRFRLGTADAMSWLNVLDYHHVS